MFALKIAGQWPEFLPGTSVNLTLVNPIFDANNVSRVFSFPFKLPLTNRNRSIFGHQHRLDAKGKSVFTDVELYIQNIFLDKGVLWITGKGQDYIEVSFQNEVTNILEDLDKIKVNEILDSVSVPLTGSPTLILDADHPGASWRIVIDENIYFLTGLGHSKNDVNNYFFTEINADYPGFMLINGSFQMEFDLGAYPAADIKLSQLLSVTIVGGSNILEAKHDSFQDYVQSLMDTPVSSHSFPTINNTSVYGERNPLFEGYINYYKGGSFIDNTPQDEQIWEHTFIPMLRVKYILEKIRDLLSVENFDGDFWNLADLAELSLYNNRTLDEVMMANFPGGDQYLNHYKQFFDLNDHVQDMTAREFLQALQIFNYYLELKGNTLYWKKKVTQLRKISHDWTDLAEPSYLGDVNQVEGYRLKYIKDESETLLNTTQLLPYGSGKDYEFDLFPLYHATYTDFYENAGTWKTPISRSEGTIEAYGVQKDIKIRLFFDRGIQQNSDSEDYLFATNDDKDWEENTLGNISLEWDGPTGLYETFWKDFIELADTEVINKHFRLPIHVILEMRKWNNSKVSVYHNEGQFTGIVRSINFKATPEGVSVSKVQLSQLP
jgi:hypothetical protein